MTITLNADVSNELKETLIKECQGQCGTEYAYKRKIDRAQNEEGRWKRLLDEFEDIAKEFDTALDKVMEMYEGVCCNKKTLKLALSGKYKVWTKVEDIGLKDKDSAEYKNLVRIRGQEDVDKRIKFLEEQ